MTWGSTVATLIVLMVTTVTVCGFLTQGLAPATYRHAGWAYPSDALFDHSVWTYGTDYAITALLGAQAWSLWASGPRTRLQHWTLCLMIIYALSTLVGGLCHHSYTGEVERLNTTRFRCLWSLVVGLTAAAGGAQGMLAVELVRDHARTSAAGATALLGPLGALPGLMQPALWGAWVLVWVVGILLGFFSHTRPACDIFIAGSTQGLPTLLLQFCLWCTRAPGHTDEIPAFTFFTLEVSLLSIAPTIVLFPFLLSQGTELGHVNAVLHSIIFASWGCQAWGLSALVRSRSSSKHID